MSIYTLGKPYHYTLEVLDADDDRITALNRFITPMQAHDLAIGYLHQHPEACRIQLWFGSTDIDNPNVETDWVNSYQREPFSEFNQQAMAIRRTSKVIRITGRGEKFVDVVPLPPIYSLGGNWQKVTVKNGKRQKKTRRLDLEAIGS